MIRFLRTRLSPLVALSAMLFFAHADLSASAAQQGSKHPLRKIELPIQEWIAQGEHTDFPWKIEISKPALSYEQRMRVKLSADVRADKLQGASVTRDLHFIVKVADENGSWTKDESYTPFPITHQMDRHSDVQMETEMYLRPGKYRIATIVYDSVLKQRNVAFNNVDVPKVQNDPLPDLQKNLPQVEHLPGSSDGQELFGAESVSLPVATRHRVQIDLVVDTSKYEDEEDRGPGPLELDRFGRVIPQRTDRLTPKPVKDPVHLGRLLQSAAVLSAITPSDGCVSVTALDPLKRKIVFGLTPAEKLDWVLVREKLLAKNGDMVDVADFTGRREAPKFLQEQLESLMAGASGCNAAARIILVLSNGKHFADKSTKPHVDTRHCNGKCELYYLHQEGREERDSDELKQMLSSATVLDARDPTQFRQKLSDLIKKISSL